MFLLDVPYPQPPGDGVALGDFDTSIEDVSHQNYDQKVNFWTLTLILNELWFGLVKNKKEQSIT